ncbi:MAG: hypothetical protein M1820_009087 [Bogoriella megaspora]|nr:MAG: hypothetical protein M1820_009087 [Bogoriella megaspora]
MAGAPDIPPLSIASQVLRPIGRDLDIGMSEVDFAQFERDLLRDAYTRDEQIISLGFRNGVEYGWSTRVMHYVRPIPDEDEDVKLPYASKTKNVAKGWMTRSLHAISESYQGDSTATFSTSVNGLENQMWENNVILARFVQIGMLWMRSQGDADWDSRFKGNIEFAIVKSLGPPEREGFWIIADAKLLKYAHGELEEDERPMCPTDEEVRESRVQKLPGFQDEIAFARIKESVAFGQFELEEQSASKFVLSDYIWLPENLSENN